ncbi:hypothetical protein [Oryza sativa Japonica Group]|uniref:Uncharacterized protein B1096D03.30 n=1 Tax=Oryza sativa subsp. japonica TaxID=39947 RepID=Q5VPZ0_ORYSJ|nr:hypothetical protein [Oryza sativa Japonica Group]
MVRYGGLCYARGIVTAPFRAPGLEWYIPGLEIELCSRDGCSEWLGLYNRTFGAGWLGGASAASTIEVEGGDIMDPRGSGGGGCGTSTVETLHERERNLSGLSGDSGNVWRP